MLSVERRLTGQFVMDDARCVKREPGSLRL